MSDIFNKWVAMWGNAVSISENRPEAYAKNITLRYPVFCPFDGDKIRLTFDNYCGYEDVQIDKVTVYSGMEFLTITFNGEQNLKIEAGGRIVSDEIDINISKHSTMYVSFYIKDYTLMRSSVYVQGPLSGGMYGIGDLTQTKEFNPDTSRKTNIYYFLSNISINTKPENEAIVCYGDSITAQDWPDYLQKRLIENGIENISIIRRATSGSRILREYSCITYESYGLKGTKRFEHEVITDGAKKVIIQQGINDIIHPVGTDVNIFRPMSDLPTIEELCKGMDYYISKAKEFGYEVILGTLLPIEGWRTYADFREDLKNSFNDYIRNNDRIDGVIDFDLALQNPNNPKAFAEKCDSGDHLHPSAYGYEQMAILAYKYITDNINKKFKD